eukprot:5212910-Heterocapsa_arctica.AAC.1
MENAQAAKNITRSSGSTSTSEQGKFRYVNKEVNNNNMNKPGKGAEPNNNANIETKTVEQWWEAQEKQKEEER